MNFLGDYSKFTYLYLLRNKDKAKDKFIKYEKMKKFFDIFFLER